MFYRKCINYKQLVKSEHFFFFLLLILHGNAIKNKQNTDNKALFHCLKFKMAQ